MHRYLFVAKQALTGHVPGADSLRSVKRRWLGYRPDPANIRSTLGDLEAMEAALKSLPAGQCRPFAGARVLEVGSGWFPTVPLALALRGARQVTLTDHIPHLDTVSFAEVTKHLRQVYPAFAALPERARFEDFPFRYVAPFSADLVADGSVDIVVSRAVLEHVPPAGLDALHRQLLPKLAPGGLMVHCVDHSDHLAHHDKRISMVNFLTWPDWKHRLVNRLTRDGENRLRHSDYIRLFESTGYRVLLEQGQVHGPTAEALKKLRLQPRFQHHTADDLATLLSIYVIAPDLLR